MPVSFRGAVFCRQGWILVYTQYIKRICAAPLNQRRHMRKGHHMAKKAKIKALKQEVASRKKKVARQETKLKKAKKALKKAA